MRKVFKYDLYGGYKYNFWADLPRNSEILSVGTQLGYFVVWAVVDPNEKLTDTYSFHIAGTGHELCEFRGDYLNRIDDHGLHFHVFYNGVK